MPNATDMFAGASLAGVDPFHPSSIFKDPSAAGRDQLSTIHGNLSMLSSVPGLDGGLTSQISSVLPMMAGYSSMIQANTADRVKSIHADLQSVLAVKNIRSSVSTADGGGITLDCSLVNDIFGSVANIGSMIGETIAKIQHAMSDVLHIIGDIFNAGMGVITSAITSAINAAKSAIKSALDTVTKCISDAQTALTDMINSEKEKIAGFMHELLGFGFLKSLPHLEVCGQNVMSGILDTSKINMGMLGAL